MSEKWTIVKADRDAIVAAVQTARESSGQARYLQAVATGLVVKADAIGEGRMYASQKDYATALDVSQAAVSGLKNLAVAIDLGLDTENKAWGLVSRRAGNIGKAVRDPKATLPKVVAAAKAAEAKVKADAAAKVGKPTVTADEKAASDGTTEPTTPRQQADAALDTLRSVLADLTGADRTAIRNGVASILADLGKGTPADMPQVKSA
jgi:hypothetical protein